MIPFMAQNAADITYTALPLPVPAGGQPATLVFTNGWAASARTKYPNAAAALVAGRIAGDLREGVMRAAEAIDSGAVQDTVKKLRAFAQKV